MIHYEVLMTVDLAQGAAFERYMRERHIPEIFASGCFERIHFDQAGPLRFRACYVARVQADFDRYQREFAPALRADFATQFPIGVITERNVWLETQRWGG